MTFWGLYPHQWSALSTIATFLAVAVALFLPVALRLVDHHRRRKVLRSRLLFEISQTATRLYFDINRPKHDSEQITTLDSDISEQLAYLRTLQSEFWVLGKKERSLLTEAIFAAQIYSKANKGDDLAANKLLDCLLKADTHLRRKNDVPQNPDRDDGRIHSP